MWKMDPRWLRDYSDYFYMGLMFPSCIAVGTALGWIVDHFFGTDPWGKMGGFFFGVFAAFVNFVRDYKNIQGKKKNESQKYKEAGYNSSDNRSGGPDRPTEL